MNQVRSAPIISIGSAVLHDDIRPSWSKDVISWLLGSPSLSEHLRVLDLGAGTGLGTRPIATLGHAVAAIDPSEDMLSVLRKACDELSPEVAARITTVTGSAERIPLPKQSVDAIICLQAWHWVDPELTKSECDRVLKQNGAMGLAWHIWDRTNEWVKALAALVEPAGAPTDQTRSIPDEFAGRGTFERKDFPFDYELSVDQLVQLANSWSYVIQRPDRNAVLAKVRDLGEKAKSLGTGLVEFPHITAALRLHQPDTGFIG